MAAASCCCFPLNFRTKCVPISWSRTCSGRRVTERSHERRTGEGGGGGSHRLHTTLAVRPSEQQAAASEHGGRDDGGVPGDADDVGAAQAGEVLCYAAVDFVSWKKAAVAMLFPLGPAAKLLQHATQHVRRCIGVFVAVGEVGERQTAGQGRRLINKTRRGRALQAARYAASDEKRRMHNMGEQLTPFAANSSFAAVMLAGATAERSPRGTFFLGRASSAGIKELVLLRRCRAHHVARFHVLLRLLAAKKAGTSAGLATVVSWSVGSDEQAAAGGCVSAVFLNTYSVSKN